MADNLRRTKTEELHLRRKLSARYPFKASVSLLGRGDWVLVWFFWFDSVLGLFSWLLTCYFGVGFLVEQSLLNSQDFLSQGKWSSVLESGSGFSTRSALCGS